MSEEERRITIYLITCLIVIIIILCIGKKKYLISYLFVTLSTPFSLEFVMYYFLWLVSLGSSRR